MRTVGALSAFLLGISVSCVLCQIDNRDFRNTGQSSFRTSGARVSGNGFSDGSGNGNGLSRNGFNVNGFNGNGFLGSNLRQAPRTSLNSRQTSTAQLRPVTRGRSEIVIEFRNNRRQPESVGTGNIASSRPINVVTSRDNFDQQNNFNQAHRVNMQDNGHSNSQAQQMTQRGVGGRNDFFDNNINVNNHINSGPTNINLPSEVVGSVNSMDSHHQTSGFGHNNLKPNQNTDNMGLSGSSTLDGHTSGNTFTNSVQGANTIGLSGSNGHDNGISSIHNVQSSVQSGQLGLTNSISNNGQVPKNSAQSPANNDQNGVGHVKHGLANEFESLQNEINQIQNLLSGVLSLQQNGQSVNSQKSQTLATNQVSTVNTAPAVQQNTPLIPTSGSPSLNSVVSALVNAAAATSNVNIGGAHAQTIQPSQQANSANLVAPNVPAVAGDGNIQYEQTHLPSDVHKAVVKLTKAIMKSSSSPGLNDSTKLAGNTHQASHRIDPIDMEYDEILQRALTNKLLYGLGHV